MKFETMLLRSQTIQFLSSTHKAILQFKSQNIEKPQDEWNKCTYQETIQKDMEFFTTFKGEGLNIGQKLKIKKVQSLKGQNGQNS